MDCHRQPAGWSDSDPWYNGEAASWHSQRQTPKYIFPPPFPPQPPDTSLRLLQRPSPRRRIPGNQIKLQAPSDVNPCNGSFPSYAQTMIFSAVITEAEEGGYVAFNPETGTTTQGETFDKEVANLREATELYLEVFP